VIFYYLLYKTYSLINKNNYNCKKREENHKI
jgi:hypothetical protein